MFEKCGCNSAGLRTMVVGSSLNKRDVTTAMCHIRHSPQLLFIFVDT